jgi:hypothetical protein
VASRVRAPSAHARPGNRTTTTRRSRSRLHTTLPSPPGDHSHFLADATLAGALLNGTCSPLAECKAWLLTQQAAQLPTSCSTSGQRQTCLNDTSLALPRSSPRPQGTTSQSVSTEIQCQIEPPEHAHGSRKSNGCPSQRCPPAAPGRVTGLAGNGKLVAARKVCSSPLLHGSRDLLGTCPIVSILLGRHTPLERVQASLHLVRDLVLLRVEIVPRPLARSRGVLAG